MQYTLTPIHSTCILSSFRLVFSESQDDVTYKSVGVTSWTLAEITSGVICAAVPTLRPLMSRYFSDFGSGNKSTRTNGDYGTKPKDTIYAKTSRQPSEETGMYEEDDMEIELVRQGTVKAMDLEADHPSQRDHR